MFNQKTLTHTEGDKMKWTVLYVMVATTLGCGTARASSINITTMQFYDVNGVSDTIPGGQPITTNLFNSALTGFMHDDSPFFGTTWTAYQVMWNDAVTGSSINWNTTSISGSYSYNYTLDAGEVAVGLMFSWGSAVDVAILQIFDCSDGINCTGVNNDPAHPGVPGSEMTDGPWPGQHLTFSGLTAVPVPAAVWLFGSGLIGLLGLAKHKTT